MNTKFSIKLFLLSIFTTAFAWDYDFNYDPYLYNGYDFYGAGALMYSNYHLNNQYYPTALMLMNQGGYLGFPGWFPSFYNWDYSPYFGTGLYDLAYYGTMSGCCGMYGLDASWSSFTFPYYHHGKAFGRHRRHRHHRMQFYGGYMNSDSRWGRYYQNKYAFKSSMSINTSSNSFSFNSDQQLNNQYDETGCKASQKLVHVPIQNLLDLAQQHPNPSNQIQVTDVYGKKYSIDQFFVQVLPELSVNFKEALSNASLPENRPQDEQFQQNHGFQTTKSSYMSLIIVSISSILLF